MSTVISTVPARGPAAFRADFPMLDRVTYLASCSHGARSRSLDAAMSAMLDEIGQGGGPWPRYEEQVERARAGFAALINARPEQIALLPNASIGAYQVASTLAWDRRPGLITTDAEFPSLAHVWLTQRPRGADIRFTDVTAGAAGYLDAIDERTRLVSVPMTTYQDAVRLPVAEIADAAHAAGARVFVDAYQAVGVEPVDVTGLDCDYLVAGPMKYLLGLPGLAFLYVREPAGNDRDPRLTGWFGRVDPFRFDPRQLDFPDRATRFETGTPAVGACYAANAGLSLIAELDLAAVRRHIADLTGYALAALTDQGERVRTPDDPDLRGAHIGLLTDDPGGLGQWLAGQGITVSPRGDVVRIAFHYYNQVEDVDVLCAALRRYRSMTGHLHYRDNNFPAGGGSYVDS